MTNQSITSRKAIDLLKYMHVASNFPDIGEVFPQIVTIGFHKPRPVCQYYEIPYPCKTRQILGQVEELTTDDKL